MPLPIVPSGPLLPQKFKLTASNVARYFKHQCDRLFRWDAVEGKDREKAGIGWSVPKRERAHTRPAARLLMAAGDEFERAELDKLVKLLGSSVVMGPSVAGVGGRTVIKPLTLQEFKHLFENNAPEYVAQLDIDLSAHFPAEANRFLERFGLDPAIVSLSPARPDLVQIISEDKGGYKLRIWDYKASPAARHEHFIQVAYYSLLLEHAITALGLSQVSVDVECAVIRSRVDEPEHFELHPYRLAVEEFLRRQIPGLLATLAADAHFHVCAKCMLCEYLDMDKGCQMEADAGFDLSRIAYISSWSKRKLVQAGLSSHRQLSSLDIDGVQARALRAQSHDLSTNLARYIASAQALDDGRPRPLTASTLQMPYWEDIRVVVSAEQDGVTGLCFALGLKTFEGWDEENSRPKGKEEVFIADKQAGEAEMLLEFLKSLNGLLERVGSANRAISSVPLGEDPEVKSASEALERAEEALVEFKSRYPRLYKAKPEHAPLLLKREKLTEEIKTAKARFQQAQKDVPRQRRRQQQSLHIYFYDSLDLFALKFALERHIADAPQALRSEIIRLVRLFPPESVLPDAETFRTIPGTVLVSVLRQLVALPVPYIYDLESVSRIYQPHNATGEERGYTYRPAYGFGWKHSNQIAFERIHDLWSGSKFETKKGALTVSQIRSSIEATIRDKLRATDSVIRRLKQDHRDQKAQDGIGFLLLVKEPFVLHESFDPTDFELLDALRVFSLIEAALSELQTKHVHTLPIADRVAKFESISGLHYLAGRDGDGGAVLWFEFDPACRDAKFSEGDWSLVVTPEDQPRVLLNSVDGTLFGDQPAWRIRNFRVSIVAISLASNPPQIALKPSDPTGFRQTLNLSKRLVLDKLHVDYLTVRVTDTLRRLQSSLQSARHVAELVEQGTISTWSPFIPDHTQIESELRQTISGVMDESGKNLDPSTVMNAGQWKAWRGVFTEPLSMIWGPPGTGKTHVVAHILLGYALAARSLGRPLRILVTAATHHAIVNVLGKTAQLAALYDFGAGILGIKKLGDRNDADSELPPVVNHVGESELAGEIEEESPHALIVGSTVWGLYKAMQDAPGPGLSFFDVVLVDEASQLKFTDSIIAMSASKPGASVILAGDDKQLPPIILGTYPDEHASIFSSVFAYARHKLEQRAEHDSSVMTRVMFQLTQNFRMNEPLTAYPRSVIYGDYESIYPDRRITLASQQTEEVAHLLSQILQPERPALLVRYVPPRSYTARNPIEAELAAQLVLRLSQTLLDPRTAIVYTPDAFAERAVAVLSPHRAQNSTIRATLRSLGFGSALLPMPLVDTVEKLQGKEREVIIVSYGVADAEYAESEADFLLSQNRFNVSATRARGKLIVLCSDVVLNAVPSDRQTLLDSMMLKEFRTFCKDGPMYVDFLHPEMGNVSLSLQWREFGRPKIALPE